MAREGRHTAHIIIVISLALLAGICPLTGHAEEAPKGDGDLEQAIWLYKHENFEEALTLLKKLRDKDPQSSMAAYYLGITYKQLQDYVEARPHLEAALTLQPKVKNALPELIDVLYQTDQTDEAKKWLEIAEKEGVNPAQVAFFKGLILLKEGKDPDGARVAFARAVELDESLTETIKYYQGLAYLQSQKLSQARDVFQQIVTRQPSTDLAALANEYVDAISRKEEAAKPFHASVGYAVQYDTNVILKPDDSTLATAVGNKGDWRQAPTFQADYTFKPAENFAIRPGYAFYNGKQTDLGFYDLVSNDFSLQPALYLKSAAIAFPAHFNHVTVNDKAYLGLAGIGNVNSITLARNQMAQLSFQYNRKDYLWQPQFADENRDSNEYLWSIGWFYFFAKNQEGFANIRYALNFDDTKGNNWRYLGNRASVTSTIPLMKRVKLNVSADYFLQLFEKTNSVYEKKRFDNVLTLSNLLAIEIIKDLELQLQYTYINNISTLGIYKYKRNVYSMGIRYDF